MRAHLNPRLEIEGLLRTMYDPRNTLALNVSADLQKHFGDKLYRTVIPRNVRLAEAPSYGVPALHLDRTSKGAQAYLRWPAKCCAATRRISAGERGVAMAKLKGLGRGLDALLVGVERNARQANRCRRIAGRPYSARASISRAREWTRRRSPNWRNRSRRKGVMQPILVRPVDGGRYEIIAGERRWRAAQRAGLSEVPALVRDVPDQAALALALIENIQREDLNPLEEAQGIQRLIDEFGLTHEAAAQAVGRSRSAVTNLLRLTQLAKPVQDYLLAGEARHGTRARFAGAAGGAAGGRGGQSRRTRAVGARYRAHDSRGATSGAAAQETHRQVG